ncbi:hypothetical protein J5N97_027663 [Dioscorea zingiberensis]|uniref:Uncharacterized protein n=1 Tax=Dioscorea zingiberensis TaxID=325984 RepID=A0A9D5BXB7_9LILI|nr:hypothetical protein J5N97_027663 [Dioscorea zingiberensis]
MEVSGESLGNSWSGILSVSSDVGLFLLLLGVKCQNEASPTHKGGRNPENDRTRERERGRALRIRRFSKAISDPQNWCILTITDN